MSFHTSDNDLMSECCDYPKCAVTYNVKDEHHKDERWFGKKQDVNHIIPRLVLIEIRIGTFGNLSSLEGRDGEGELHFWLTECLLFPACCWHLWQYLNSIWQKQVVLHLPIGLWLCIPVHGYVYREGRGFFRQHISCVKILECYTDHWKHSSHARQAKLGRMQSVWCKWAWIVFCHHSPSE